MNATLNPRVCRAFAAGSSRGSSSRGMIADRAGVLTANAPDCTATSANSTHSCLLPSHACTASPMVAAHVTNDATSATRRRS